MTDLLDISATITGRPISADQAAVVASLKGLSVDDFDFIRARYRAPKDDKDVDYVLAQHKTSRSRCHTFAVEDLNREILQKEIDHVP